MERRAGQVLSRGIGAGDVAAPTVAAVVGNISQHRCSPVARDTRSGSASIRRSPSTIAATRKICSLSCGTSSASSATKSRFPGKGTCLAIYSRGRSTSGATLSEVLAASFPWCAHWEAELSKLCSPRTPPRRACRRTGLRRPAALLGAYGRRAGAGPGDRRSIRPCAGRRISGTTNRLQAFVSCSASKPDGAGLAVVGDDARVDLFVSMRPPCATSWISRTRSILPRASSPSTATTGRRSRSSMRRERGHRAGQRALQQEPVDRAHGIAEAAADQRSRRSRSGARASPTRSTSTASAEWALKAQAVLFRSAQPQLRSSRSSAAARHSVRQVRLGWAHPRCGARQGCPVRAALGRQSASRMSGFPHRPPAAGGGSGTTAAKLLDAMEERLIR